MFNQFEAELYQRLQNYELDDPTHEFGFTRHLMKNHGWTEHYAYRAIAEYKKFAFLTVVADYQIAPSDAVDQVWHAHILLTQSYWEEFCPNILRQKLHHHPARGGKAERAEFHHLYRQTIASYRHYFGNPPQDIWSPPEIRFGKELKMQRISTRDNWIIPKSLPKFKFNLIKFSFVLGLFIFLILGKTVIASQNIAIDNSQNYILLYFYTTSLIIFNCLLYYLARTPKKQPYKPQLDIYQTACLAGGKKRVTELALVKLVHKGYLKPNIRNRTFTIVKRFGTELSHPEQVIMSQVQYTPEFKKLIDNVINKYGFPEIWTYLEDKQLLMYKFWGLISIFANVGILLVFYINEANNIGLYTFVSIIIWCFVDTNLINKSRTHWGDYVLEDIEERENSFDPIQRFALYGESALSGGALDDLRQIYQAQRKEEAAAASCGCGC